MQLKPIEKARQEIVDKFESCSSQEQKTPLTASSFLDW